MSVIANHSFIDLPINFFKTSTRSIIQKSSKAINDSSQNIAKLALSGIVFKILFFKKFDLNNITNRVIGGSYKAISYFPITIAIGIVMQKILQSKYSKEEHKVARKKIDEMIENKQITTSDILIKAPILEEFIFRGGLQTISSPLISSVLFGYAHTLGDKNLKPITTVQAIVAGLTSYNMLAPVYNTYGLIGSIAAHFTNNLLAILLRQAGNYWKKKKVKEEKVVIDKPQSIRAKTRKRTNEIFKKLKPQPNKKQKIS